MHAFSPKNPIFCTFLQGGGTTFWQAQKRGFWGSGGVAPVAARAHFLCHVSRDTKRPPATFLVGYIIYSYNGKVVFSERTEDPKKLIG